jgi:Kef-type K+ transport system membrane component KefB
MKEEKPWIVSFIVVGIIYNPILSIHLTRPIWTVINLLTIILIVLSIFISNAIFTKSKKDIKKQ